MDIYYKYLEGDAEDTKEIENYFINSHNPEQWALFDISNSWENENDASQSTRKGYAAIYLNMYEAHNDPNLRTASASITCITETGADMKLENKFALEMIKKGSRWYISGFSTFPYYKGIEQLRAEVEQYIKFISDGSLFNGMLKGKKIAMGQIQFWSSRTNSFSLSPEDSDSIKVYLNISENNKNVIYKLVLKKETDGKWKPVLLSSERLYSLE